MAYGIVVTEKMSGTYNAADLVSVRFTANNAPAAIENGNVVLVGALEPGSREVHVATAPQAGSPKANIALIATPEVIYDERLTGDLGNFRNEAGEIARGYILDKPHQWFAVTGDALDGGNARVVGALVELQDGTKLLAVAQATQNSTQIGVIRQVYTNKGKTYYAIETV